MLYPRQSETADITSAVKWLSIEALQTIRWDLLNDEGLLAIARRVVVEEALRDRGYDPDTGRRLSSQRTR